MENTVFDKKELVKFLLKKSILITPDLLDSIDKISSVSEFYEFIKRNIISEDFMIINKDIQTLLSNKSHIDANWLEFEKLKAISEKRKNGKIYEKFLGYLTETQEKTKTKEVTSTKKTQFLVKPIFSYNNLQTKKREIQDFVSHFNSRFRTIEAMISKRAELVNLMSIQRLNAKKERDTVSIIGMVYSKQYTKNKNLILELEDPTGNIKVLVNHNKPELFEQAKDIVLDEVIGIIGQNGDKILFSNNIVWPDVPLTKELKKCNDEVYAVFLSDLHVGSSNFLEKEVGKFIRWINAEAGSESQRAVARRAEYIFIVGDLVDGVGIYPGQEADLEITDIYKQYERCAEILSEIPTDKAIIICPGNHDAMRIAEPQMVLYKDIAKPLWDLPNVFMVSNPSLVNIHSSSDFPGFDILLYHGYSFDYYAREVESIRNKGGYDRADLLMKFLMKRRHLAPAHTSTLYSPDVKEDSLVIKTIPDIFVTGHIHKCAAASYRNISLICGSCWQSKTSFQEKVGHNPEPCRVPIVNLASREMKIMKFGD